MTTATNAVTIYETAAGAAAAQVKALVEARYTVALARPRDMDLVREKLLKECRRPSFAEVARYNKPIGKGIIGPSIRFAEAAIRCMGNVVIEEMTVYDDPEKRIIQVSVTDLESNVPYTTSVTVEKTVERRKKKDDDQVVRERTNSYGDKLYVVLATEDEILNKKNAILSKAIRTLGLRHVPGDLVEEAMELVEATQKTKDAQDPDAARRKLLDAFGALNVPASELKQYVGHDLATLSPAELTELRALHAAIKDGEASWKSAMLERFPDAPTSSEKRMADNFGEGESTKKDPPKDKAKTDAATPPKSPLIDAIAKAAGNGLSEDATKAILIKHGGGSGSVQEMAARITGVMAQTAINEVLAAMHENG